MRAFLRKNGFRWIRSTNAGFRDMHYHPEDHVFVGRRSDGEWVVSAYGSENLDAVERWRGKLAKELERLDETGK